MAENALGRRLSCCVLCVASLLLYPGYVGCSFFAPTLGEFAQGSAGGDTRSIAGASSGATTGGNGSGGAMDPPACSDGNCGTSCLPDQGDCNDSRADGCETPLDTLQNCGSCGVECTNEHGVTNCSAATSGRVCLPTCVAGFADCDSNPRNGCETNINTDSLSCGACGAACPANGGTPRCQAGKCGVSSCNEGFGDCSNVGSCVTNLNTDPKNCGACGHVCSANHGQSVCNAGNCEITCNSGWGDCNPAGIDGGPPADDGCETQLNVPDTIGNVPNCGACGQACARRSLTTVNLSQCMLGVCAKDCQAGFGDCDNNRDLAGCTNITCGCETSVSANAANCGACGHACQGGACINSICQCPDSKPTSGATCTLASTVTCGPYEGCTCSCKSGVFQCTC